MAKKSENSKAAVTHKCRDCALSHDWFSRAHDGALLLGYCQHLKEGKYAILLDDNITCLNFKER